MLHKNTNTVNICNICKTREKSFNSSINKNTVISDDIYFNNSIPRCNNLTGDISQDNKNDVNSHIPPRSNLSKDHHRNNSQVKKNNEVYSWITSNEQSSIFDSISDSSDRKWDKYNDPSSISYSKAIASQYNEYLQSIDIESVLNRNKNSRPHFKDSFDNNNNNHLWPENTCLIVGSSILNNLDEHKLNKGNSVVKVRPFPGSTIEDMYSYITPLLRKQPTYIILPVGGNDAPYNQRMKYWSNCYSSNLLLSTSSLIVRYIYPNLLLDSTI